MGFSLNSLAVSLVLPCLSIGITLAFVQIIAPILVINVSAIPATPSNLIIVFYVPRIVISALLTKLESHLILNYQQSSLNKYAYNVMLDIIYHLITNVFNSLRVKVDNFLLINLCNSSVNNVLGIQDVKVVKYSIK